jgi:hypothetical protein
MQTHRFPEACQLEWLPSVPRWNKLCPFGLISFVELRDA